MSATKSEKIAALTAAVVFVLLIVSCTTSTGVAAGSDVKMQLEQLPRSEFDVMSRGAISIAYQLHLQNAGREPITLRRVELKAVGRSPYVLRDSPATLEEVVAPGAEATVLLSMWAYPRTSESSQVWLTGTAYFDSPSGAFSVPIKQSLRVPE